MYTQNNILHTWKVKSFLIGGTHPKLEIWCCFELKCFPQEKNVMDS